MSIADQIQRLRDLRDRTRTVLVNWGVVSDSGAKLDTCVQAIEGITDNGAIEKKISLKTQEINIPSGYHDGSGFVSISEEEKTKIISTNIRSGVTILGVTGALSTEGGSTGSSGSSSGVAVEEWKIWDVPDRKMLVEYTTSNRTETTIDVTFIYTYTVTTEGGWSGYTQKVTPTINTVTYSALTLKSTSDSIGTDTWFGSPIVKSATYTVTDITQDTSNLSFTVAFSSTDPDDANNTSTMTKSGTISIPTYGLGSLENVAKAENLLEGTQLYDENMNIVDGTMANRGSVVATFDGIEILSYTIPQGYHDGLGTVSLADDIAIRISNVNGTTPNDYVLATEIETLEGLRNELRIHLMGMSLVGSDADLETCVEALQTVDTYGHTLTTLTAPDEYVQIPAGYYPTGCEVSLQRADQQNISESNIKNGVTILGVEGSFTSDATAASTDILEGQTAYVNGSKVTGSLKKQVKTVTPTKSAQMVYPDAGSLFSAVAVGAIPASYFDISGTTADASDVLAGAKFVAINGTLTEGTIASKSSSDLTASGETVNVPAGYYPSGASKSISTVTQATPIVSIDANGLITASATQSAGYVAAGTETGTKQLTKRGAADVTDSGLKVNIPSGYYPNAIQKTLADSNLLAENIRSGKTIFGVAGTYEASGTSDFTYSNGETVNIKPSGTLDGTSLWGNYAITPVGYTSEYAIFEYTLTAGTSSTSGTTSAGYEEYSMLIRFSGTNVSERTYCIIVKPWSTAWKAGSTANRFATDTDGETGYFCVPISGAPSSVTVLARFKTTAVSNVASATGTVTF